MSSFPDIKEKEDMRKIIGRFGLTGRQQVTCFVKPIELLQTSADVYDGSTISIFWKLMIFIKVSMVDIIIFEVAILKFKSE